MSLLIFFTARKMLMMMLANPGRKVASWPKRAPSSNRMLTETETAASLLILMPILLISYSQ